MAGDTPPQPRLVVLSAPSGAGKTTLCKMLLAADDRFTLSVSSTTRPRRPNEENGVHYHFLDKAAFQKAAEAGEFVEWAQVHGNLYGTSKKAVESALAAGKHVVFDIDVQGAKSLKNTYGNRALLIFIHPPSMEELKQRLVDRKGDSSTAIETRLQNAYDEVGWSKSFDYEIVNDNLDLAFQKLSEILKTECR